ncbi:solute carrier family 35 member SLC35F1/F2/F6 [Kipferlia bialata]|uniref:Solute carrier family 35 member SLC35F1/F2/F6 n=1 Tax=Kipferlia bialata TaxID=797122 RepID=A0A9K3D4R3_9EUKA|nr:solute carrier family 35 member SLC35F1/F2/F6 [Kipferlia bialata]|eukprot:g9994.t1
MVIVDSIGESFSTSQSWLTYVCLSLWLVPRFSAQGRERFRKHRQTRTGESLPSQRLYGVWWHYMILAFLDVEANFIVVKAYKYTSVSSVMALTCFSIPTSVALAVLIFHRRFSASHMVGIAVALLGMAIIILIAASAVDTGTLSLSVGSTALLGDILALVAAALYGFNNTMQELLVTRFDRHEFLGLLGVFGALIGGVQACVTEMPTLLPLIPTLPASAVYAWLGFTLVLVIQYSVTPVLLTLTSATFLNLSLLATNVWGVLFDYVFFGNQARWVNGVALLFIVGGLVIYLMQEEGGKGEGGAVVGSAPESEYVTMSPIYGEGEGERVCVGEVPLEV